MPRDCYAIGSRLSNGTPTAPAAGGPRESGSVAVKLAAIHPRYSYSQHGRVMHELLPRLQSLARLARRYDIALTIDAEESDRLEPSLDLIECLLADPDLAAWSG